VNCPEAKFEHRLLLLQLVRDINVVASGQYMSNTTEMTASPRLRAMFVIGSDIMLARWAWSLVPPIGLYLLIGAIDRRGQTVRRAGIALLSLPE
jgi:hypothetical protein